MKATELSVFELVSEIVHCALNLHDLASASGASLSCFSATLTYDEIFQNYLKGFLASCLLTYFQHVKWCAKIFCLSTVLCSYPSPAAYMEATFSNILQTAICITQEPPTFWFLLLQFHKLSNTCNIFSFQAIIFLIFF